MRSVRRLTAAALLTGPILVVAIFAIEARYDFTADKWSAIGQVASAAVAVPGFLLIAAQIAALLEQYRADNAPRVLVYTEHSDPEWPGGSVDIVIENVGGGVGRQACITLDPPLPETDETARLRQFLGSSFSTLLPGKPVRTCFVFGAISESGLQPHYTATVTYFDASNQHEHKDVFVLDLAKMRLIDVVVRTP